MFKDIFDQKNHLNNTKELLQQLKDKATSKFYNAKDLPQQLKDKATSKLDGAKDISQKLKDQATSKLDEAKEFYQQLKEQTNPKIDEVKEYILGLINVSDDDIQAICQLELDRFESIYQTVPLTHPQTQRLNNIVNKYYNMYEKNIVCEVYDCDYYMAYSFPDGHIKISNKIMNDFTDEQILFIFGHELGHIVNGDSKTGLIYSQIANYLSNLQKSSFITKIPFFSFNIITTLLLLMGINIIATQATNLATSSLGNYISRNQEFAADKFGVDVLLAAHCSVDDATSALELLKTDLSDDEENMNFFQYLFATHPTIDKRIAAINEYVTKPKSIS